MEHNILQSIFPCVYLLTLGTAKDLRQSMNIDAKYNNDMIVCKYGKTDNLERRLTEHMASYGNIPNTNVMLKYYAYVDPKNITEAENDIKNYMESLGAKFNYSNYNELVILTPKLLNDPVNKQYTFISKVYAGNITDLLTKIRDLQNDLELTKERQARILSENINELLQKDKRIMELEKIMECELLKKEIEMLKMKIK